MPPLLPLHPLGKTPEEISQFITELLGPSDLVGYYAPEIRIEKTFDEIIVEALWMGKDADSIHIDRDAAGAFVSQRVWHLPFREAREHVVEAEG